jgi:hypothetical protein
LANPGLFVIDRGAAFARSFMRSTSSGTLALFALCIALEICPVLPANAQDSAGPPAPNSVNPTRTGKERLGRKWMDEQRIDNCNVPIEKRGAKPRPSRCPPVPSG